ncbi:MAG TPA: hypothetical protein VGJ73_15250 [Verrucomicrobiae bacterium]|jgi:hypothetical protein
MKTRTGLLENQAEFVKTFLPTAIRKPRVKDGVTVIGLYRDNLYEFHMHYHPPGDWRCRCHIKKRVKFPSRGMSHFAPDDFVAYYRKVPLEFEGHQIAHRWWTANREQIIQTIDSGDWELVKSTKFLLEVIESGNKRYALYSDSSQVWVDVYGKESCGHWVRWNNDQLLVFNDAAAAREAVRA